MVYDKIEKAIIYKVMRKLFFLNYLGFDKIYTITNLKFIKNRYLIKLWNKELFLKKIKKQFLKNN